jgi:hypothetical protein
MACVPLKVVGVVAVSWVRSSDVLCADRCALHESETSSAVGPAHGVGLRSVRVVLGTATVCRSGDDQ